MQEHYGFDDYTIHLIEEHKNNRLMTSLYAIKDDNTKSVLLTMKDGLNKVMEKFTHINEYELTTKINQAK